MTGRDWLGTTFSSLATRNYRVFFIAQLVSTNGTWMQRVAQFWLVLHLSGSGVALGLTGALQSLPVLIGGPWGGLIADRIDKRGLLIATQAASGVVGLVLAALTLSGVVELWMVYLLALCLGLINVFDNPGRQSFVTEMVGPRKVANAVALNSAVFTSSRMVGPAIAGLLIASVGTGWCFLYNGLSFFAVVGGLMLMRRSELHSGSPIARGPGQIKEGLRYTAARPELVIPLLLMMVIGTLAINWNVVLPLLARYTYHSGAATFGGGQQIAGRYYYGCIDIRCSPRQYCLAGLPAIQPRPGQAHAFNENLHCPALFNIRPNTRLQLLPPKPSELRKHKIQGLLFVI